MTGPLNAREKEEDGAELGELLVRELTTIPLENWGYFFPCQVAVWRFMSARRPDLLGEIDAGYDTEPWFQGRGAEWFVATVGGDEGYLSAVESIMYPLVNALPSSASSRGFVRPSELPGIDPSSVQRLADVLSDIMAI